MLSTDENPELGTDEHQQALRDLVSLGFGRAIVNVCVRRQNIWH